MVLPDARRAVVIDTNCVLDLWVFGDPAATGLLHAVTTNSLRWCATPAMRDELQRVLSYPLIVKRLTTVRIAGAEVMARFDTHAHQEPPATRCTLRCRDPDDQMFIDLAVAHGAMLVSKDARVIELGRKLAPLGVQLARPW